MVPFLREQPRKNLRLRGFDYSQAGVYFMTLAAFRRECLFGEVIGGNFEPNEAGEIVAQEWLRSPEIRSEIELDAFVVMPNHFHAIVIVTTEALVGARVRAPLHSVLMPGLHRQPRSLGALVAGFKSAVTKRVNVVRNSPGVPVWQRNYYERIIRNEAELARVREYIDRNPSLWKDDPENPMFPGSTVATDVP